MSAEILKLESSLNDAIHYAMVAVESGQFNKVITLLEYVKTNKNSYDRVMINYALLISYMNTGRHDKAKLIIQEFEQMKIEHPDIKNVVDSIKNDLNNTTADSEIFSVNSNLDLELELDFIEKLKTIEYYNDFAQEIENGEFTNFEDIVAEQIEFYEKYILNFESKVESITPLEYYTYLIEIENDVIFWYIENKNYKYDRLVKLMANDKVPPFIKKFLLERYAHFANLGILEHIKLKFENKQIDTSLLKEQLNNVDMVLGLAKGVYLDVEKAGTVILNEDNRNSFANILRVIYIHGFPWIEYDNVIQVLAIASYIFNDFVVGREYDRATEKFTGFSFDDLKEEIKKFELYITFLLN